MAPQKLRSIRIEGNTAFVALTQGYEAIIDAADAHLVAGVNWRARVERMADGSIRRVYAGRSVETEGRERAVAMHRLIAQTPDGFDTDHKNGNGLDNRRKNLRSATKAQNQHNAATRKDSKSGIKGVSWHKTAAKWRATIRLNGKKHHLGLFSRKSDAAEAYAAASQKMHKEYGRTI